MKRHYTRGYVQRADGDDTGKPLTIVAASEGRKRDGINLTMAGADLGRFEGNPVVGYGHSYWGRDGLPIGRADRTWIDGDRLKMDISFDADDDFATKVERKYRAGFMNAFSIGFDLWDIGEDGVPARWELYEVSAVPLPMDPAALVESGRADDPLSLLGLGRAGAVLSKKNKGLVQAARDALTELLDAAGAVDDQDDARDAPPVDLARMRRLARN